jgi:hypothetical protein
MTAQWLKTKRRKKAEPAVPPRQLVEPTPEEARNGWTAETLTEYRESIAPEIAALFGPRRPPLPTRANSGYSPHRWRPSFSPFAHRRSR